MASSGGTVQYRLAQHYVTRLQQANTAFRRGHGNRTYWYNQIEQDWGQIRQWQAWSASAADELDKAQLCVEFSIAGIDILRVRQTPSERVTWLQQALDAAILVGNAEAQRTILHHLAQAHFYSARAEQATRLANELLILSQRAKDILGMGRAYYTLASVAQQLGKFDDSEDLLNKALMLFEKCQATAEIGRTYQGIGRVAHFRGDYPLAYDYFAKYLAIVEGTGREGELSVALLTLSNSLVSLQDFVTAEQQAERSVQICRNVGFIRMLPAALLSLAMCEVELDKLDSAISHYQEGIQVADSINMKNLVVSGMIDLGLIYTHLGNFEAATKCYDEALELAHQRKTPYYVCLARGYMAYLDLLQNRYEPARQAILEAIELALQLEIEPYLAKTLLIVVHFFWHGQEYEQAARWTGVLHRYAFHLNRRLFDSICRELEVVLGADQYMQIIQQGQNLDLVEVINEANTKLSR